MVLFGLRALLSIPSGVEEAGIDVRGGSELDLKEGTREVVLAEPAKARVSDYFNSN